MSARTKPQIIKVDGKPAFAVIPWKEYQKLISRYQEPDESEVWFPNDVVGANIVHGDTLVKAWREYFGISQTELAERAGMKQPALARIEAGTVIPRRTTIAKLAKAMGLDISQLAD